MVSRVWRHLRVDDSTVDVEARERLDLVRNVCGAGMPICALAMCVLGSNVAIDPTLKFTSSVVVGMVEVSSGDVRCAADFSLVMLRL